MPRKFGSRYGIRLKLKYYFINRTWVRGIPEGTVPDRELF
jgi:hypothetical protein